MKAYILSENNAHGIALANIINSANHTAIIGNPDVSDYSELIDEAVEGLSYGYELNVLISKKPLDACIEANRTSKLRAVVCRSKEDAASARKARANLIILDDGEFSKTGAAGIMRGWFGSSAEQPEEEEEEKEPSKPGKSISEMGSSALGMFKSLGIKGKKHQKEEKESKEEDTDEKKPKDGGIVKNIKYIFGLD